VQLLANGQSATTPTLIVLFGELMGENYLYQTTRVWDDPRIRSFVPGTTSGYSPLGTPYAAPPSARGMTTINAADELWNIGFRSVSRSLRKLDDAGVLVNAGSHGQIHGIGLHWEMWLLAEGGMSPLHALRAGTLNGAKTIGLDKELGSIEVGKLADIALWRLDGLDHAGIEDPVAALVLGAPRPVDLLLVGGRPIVESAELRTADVDEVARDIAAESRRLLQRVEAAA